MDRPGLQGGTTPVKLGPTAVTDPYGHANDEYQADPWFADYFCAAMGQTMSRFKGCRPQFRERRNGGIGAFTPDNVPVFDWVAPNVFMIADSNHGFKMTGAGQAGRPAPDGRRRARAQAVRARPLRRGPDVRRLGQPLALGVTRP